MHTKDYITPVGLSQKLEQIDTVQLEVLSQTKRVTVQQATSNMVQQIELCTNLAAQVELTLEQVRMATLANNLTLSVELMAPSISQTYVDEEKAKFEAAFFGGASNRESDLGENAVTIHTEKYRAGIEKPLLTGGRINIDVSLTDVDEAGSEGLSTSSAGISIVQPLLRGARTSINTQSIRIAQVNRDIVDARTKLRMIHLLAAADAAYWRLYAAQKELEVREEQYELAGNQLDHARKKVASGAAARIEIVRAEAGVASRLEAVINSENRVETQHRSLRRIMNRSDMPIDVDTQIFPQTHPDPLRLELDRAHLIHQALENRMEIIQLDLQMTIDEMEIESARNQMLPDLALTAEYRRGSWAGSRSESVSQLMDGAFDSTFVGLSFSVPLGNHASKARLQRLQLGRLVHEEEKKGQQQFIQEQVLDTVSALETSWRRILAAQQGVEAAARDYRVEEAQFQLGVRTSTDVLQATTRLADAQLSRIRAYTDYEIAQINIARATGTLLGHGNIIIQPLEEQRLSDALSPETGVHM